MLPPLSQERRLQLVGQTKEFGDARRSRSATTAAMPTSSSNRKKGQRHHRGRAKHGKEQIQELTKTYEGKVEHLLEHKRTEILQV